MLLTRAIRFLSKGFRIAASNPAPKDRTRKDWLIHVLFGRPKEMLLRPEIVLASGKTSFDFFQGIDEEETILGVGGKREHQGIKIEAVLGDPFLGNSFDDSLRDLDPSFDVGRDSLPVGWQSDDVATILSCQRKNVSPPLGISIDRIDDGLSLVELQRPLENQAMGGVNAQGQPCGFLDERALTIPDHWPPLRDRPEARN